MTIATRFKKKAVFPIPGYGRYRRSGTLEVLPEGVRIQGSHVFSLWVRLLLGFVISVCGVFLLFGGLILAYFLVEYVILDDETSVLVPWDSLTRFAADPARRLVALEFSGVKNGSPLVGEVDELVPLVAALREAVAHKDATPQVRFPEGSAATLPSA